MNHFLYLYIFYVYSLKKKNKWSQDCQVWSVSCEFCIKRVFPLVQSHTADMWVISKVLHTALFLFKIEFILQNIFTGLQCNLHCALSQWSNVWASLVFLSGCLHCWCVLLLGSPHWTPPHCFWSVSHGVVSSILGMSQRLVGSCQDYGGWGTTCHPYFSKISDTAPEAWGRTLMYDHWSVDEIWLQSVSSSISRLRFAGQGPCSLPICTHCSVLKSGSQLSRKSEQLHHSTGRASAVCGTFEMTSVSVCVRM